MVAHDRASLCQVIFGDSIAHRSEPGIFDDLVVNILSSILVVVISVDEDVIFGIKIGGFHSFQAFYLVLDLRCAQGIHWLLEVRSCHLYGCIDERRPALDHDGNVDDEDGKKQQSQPGYATGRDLDFFVDLHLLKDFVAKDRGLQ